ncbi:MAG: DJ-1/PfpI family protein [Nitrospirae bacterium]|nr:DJ-1/PfpI family protein [Nitrospirota bacterium]
MKKKLEGKKVAMVIAHQRFRDEEYLRPKEILEKEGVAVTTVSSKTDIAIGMLGAKVKPDLTLNDLKVKDYDALLFVGGGGAEEYWNNQKVHSIAVEAVQRKKVLGAICIAPVILANAGLLYGKKATVYESEIDKIKGKGAVYNDLAVVRDGNIVTANGPEAAEEFGMVIVEALS